MQRILKYTSFVIISIMATIVIVLAISLVACDNNTDLTSSNNPDNKIIAIPVNNTKTIL